MQKKKTYAFQEIEQYREYLETKHLRSKNLIVSGVFFIMFLLTMTYMIVTGYEARIIIPIGLAFVLLLIINFVMSSYGTEDSSYLKINKYISTLGMFTLATAMIVYFQSPSFIPLLFVAYAVCAIYQDIKVMIISDIYFSVSIILTIISFPELLEAQNSSDGTNFSIAFFSILFLMMLSVSAYIIMKEKSFFYNQISNSKEIEYRNIDLLIKLRKDTKKEDKNVLSYYERTNEFLQAFSDKIELPNVFEEKIAILKEMENKVPLSELKKKYLEYTEKDFKRLQKLLITNHNVLSRIAVKMTKARESDIKKREIFSGTHFKSFNKPSETTETKIIAFVIFYVALNSGLVGWENLRNADI